VVDELHDAHDAYLECARKAYGSLVAPDYSFLSELIARRPYRNVIARVRAIAQQVIDLSNWNDDVAYSLKVTIDHEDLIVWLSLVGPYAMVHRAIYDGTELRSALALPQPAGSKVAEVLVHAGFRLLTADELSMPVEFASGDNCPSAYTPLARVLFSDNEAVVVPRMDGMSDL